MVPADFFTQVEQSESAEDGEGDDFLYDFKLGGRIKAVAPSVGRHHQKVFEKGDAPAGENDPGQGGAFELQMTVPGEGHKYVGENKKSDGKEALIECGFHS